MTDWDTRPGVQRDGYVFPAYEDRCFGRIPGTAGDVLGVDVGRSLPTDLLPDGSFERVVVLLLDGLGVDRYREATEFVPTLEAAAHAGETTTLTSIYPSETAAAVTTMNTGLMPAEHGMLGWNLHLPEADLTCQTLPFRTREADWGSDEDLGEATDGSVSPRELFDGQPIYEQFESAGVGGHVVKPARLSGGYNAVVEQGATIHGERTVAEFAVTLRRQLAEAAAPAYYYAYWPDIDSACHDEGSGSGKAHAETASVGDAVGRELAKLDPATAEETLLVVTADHGHHDANPREAVDLSEMPAVWDNLATHDDGRRVLPTGGPRNLHLHVADGHRETVREAIAGAPFEARITTGEAAIEDGLFGPGEVSPKLRERVGDLLVVPETVNVWFDAEQRKLEFVGTHGGQHPSEMFVPFVATSVADLQAEL